MHDDVLQQWHAKVKFCWVVYWLVVLWGGIDFEAVENGLGGVVEGVGLL